MPRASLPFHSANLCPAAVICCFYNHFGCGFSGPRADMAAHESGEIAAHLRHVVLALAQQNQLHFTPAAQRPLMAIAATAAGAGGAPSAPGGARSESGSDAARNGTATAAAASSATQVRYSWSPAHTGAQLTLVGSDLVKNSSSRAPRSRTAQALMPTPLTPQPLVAIKVLRFPEGDRPLYFGIAAESAYRRDDEEQVIFPGSVCFVSIWSTLVRLYESGDPTQAFSGSFHAGDSWAVSVEHSADDKWLVVFYHNFQKLTFCYLRRAAGSTEPLFPYVRLFPKAEIKLINV
jgi:hypothetical protein